MTHPCELSRPVVRASTRLHAYQARRAVGEVFKELRPGSAYSRSRQCPVHVVHLKDILGDVDSNWNWLHLGSPGLPVETYMIS